MPEVSFRPTLEIVAPETPEIRVMGGDFEPVVANEQEVIGSILQITKCFLEGHVPAKNVPEYFGWKLGYIQHRVTSPFELYDGHLVLLDLFLQNSYFRDILCAVQPIPELSWIAIHPG